MKLLISIFIISLVFFTCKKDLPELIIGCMDEGACNYDPDAQVQDVGDCEFPEEGFDCNGDRSGCMDDEACNYDPDATIDDGSCEYPEQYYNCDGECINDEDEDGICDELEDSGCTDPTACNYDWSATDDDGSCEYPEGGLDCDGNCENPNDMLDCTGNACWPISWYGNGICNTPFDCEELNYDDGDCSGGCMDVEACNYDSTAIEDDGSCLYPELGYDCDGNCLNDTDEDGVCDEFEIDGCTDETASNYNPDATNDDGSCVPSCDQAWFDQYGYDGNQDGVLDTFIQDCNDLCFPYWWAGINNNGTGWCDDGSMDSGSSGQPGMYGTFYADFDCAEFNYDGGECEAGGCYDYYITAGGGSWDSEISWEFVNNSGVIVASGQGASSSYYCLDSGCYTVNLYDSYGDGWNGAYLQISSSSWTIDTGSFATTTWCTTNNMPKNTSLKSTSEKNTSQLIIIPSQGPFNIKE